MNTFPGIYVYSVHDSSLSPGPEPQLLLLLLLLLLPLPLPGERKLSVVSELRVSCLIFKMLSTLLVATQYCGEDKRNSGPGHRLGGSPISVDRKKRCRWGVAGAAATVPQGKTTPDAIKV